MTYVAITFVVLLVLNAYCSKTCQQLFYESFSREHLVRSFQRGKKEVYAEIYQKDPQGQYHWVSVHVIRIESESGALMQICLNRVLEANSEKRYEQK